MTDVVLFGVTAQWVQVVVTDPVAGIVFDTGHVAMLSPSGNSHWGYFFNPIERRTRLQVSGLPAYTQATVTVRVSNVGATAACSECVIGRALWIGNTYWRPSIGWDDWSQKARDTWGGWTITPGDYSDRLKLQVLVKGALFDSVRDRLVAYRSRAVVWVGAPGYQSLITYGYLTTFEQVLVAQGFADCNLVIEGLTVS